MLPDMEYLEGHGVEVDDVVPAEVETVEEPEVPEDSNTKTILVIPEVPEDSLGDRGETVAGQHLGGWEGGRWRRWW